MKFAGRIITVAACLIFTILYETSASDFPTEEEVLVLSKSNFKDALKLPYVLVEFYAPWCGHCKALAPEYAKTATKLAKEGSKIKLAKVDVTQEQEIAEEYEIKGYPTLKFFKDGKMIDYNGGRKADEIYKWLLKKTGPPAVTLTSVDDAKNFLESHEACTIGYFKDLECDAAKKFLEVANSIDDHGFGITSSDDIIASHEVEDGKIAIHKKFDEPKVVYDDDLDEKKIKNFIYIHSLPLIVDFNQETAQKIFGGEIKTHLLVFMSKETGHYDKYIDSLKKTAEKFRGKILSVSINTDEADHKRILDFFGMKEEDIPSARIIQFDQDMVKYKPQFTEMTADNILEFVTDFFDGKLTRNFLSEDLPEDWNKNPVYTLVGTNFKEVALDKSKHVLVEFYAPWCGHCKQLAPIYDQLGEKFQARDDVVIAKMDSTANEVEEVQISSFPTIILYKKDTNEAIHFNGKRTLEDLVKFVEGEGKYDESPEEVQEEDEDDDVPRKDEL